MKHKQQNLSKALLNGKNNELRRPTPPFWFFGTSFYFLSVAIALVLFFVIWGMLQDSSDKSPWITAGIFSSLILVGAVILREVVLRDARNRYIVKANKANYRNRNNHSATRSSKSKNKFGLQRNASVLKLIEKKSAKAIHKKELPEKHLEVFELCDEYLKLTNKELKKVQIGSTKWGAYKNGRKRVKAVHKHHLISWAAIESRRLTKDAKLSGSIAKKIETAQKANLVLESALRFYPDDSQLMESIEAVSDFIASIKISHWIEQAEKATFKGDYRKAISRYKDALFYLAREEIIGLDKEEIAENINLEIAKLRKLKAQS